MSCYFRHVKDIFAEAGIEVTSGNKKQVDQAVHRVVDTDYKNCPVTWKKLKQQTGVREEFEREKEAEEEKIVRKKEELAIRAETETKERVEEELMRLIEQERDLEE